VIMYADQVTDSMRRAISETQRRRQLQLRHNEEHGIDPQTIRKKIVDILEMVRARDDGDVTPARGRGRRGARRSAVFDLSGVPPDELGRLIQTLQEEMHEAAKDLRFEEAARLRDEIKRLQTTELAIADDPFARQSAVDDAVDTAMRSSSSSDASPAAARSTKGIPGTRAIRGRKTQRHR
jgi:excinuclease UvrABC helicase subunit UvrB